MEDVTLSNSFWSWVGTSYKFSDSLSKGTFYLFAALFVLTIILLWLFKRPIYKHYSSNNTGLLKRNEGVVFQIVGLLVIVFTVVRMVIMFEQDFQRSWEVIPLHLCRFAVVATGLILLFKKTDLIKYLAIIQIGGAAIALAVPDLNFRYEYNPNLINLTFPTQTLVSDVIGDNGLRNVTFSVGPDNYNFIDYLLAHGFALISPVVFLIIKPSKMHVKDTIITFGFFASLLILVFFINWTTSSFSSSPRWKSNYFYVGTDDVNFVYADVLGPLSRWPVMLFTMLFLGIVFLLTGIVFYGIQDIVVLEIIKGKISITISKSKNWTIYKNSISSMLKQKSY